MPAEKMLSCPSRQSLKPPLWIRVAMQSNDDDSERKSNPGSQSTLDNLDETLRSRRDAGPGGDGPLVERVKYRPALVVIVHPDPSVLGRWYQLHDGQSLTIGRSPTSEIRFPDIEEISRQHAVIWESDGVVRIRDLGSTNGTMVNGELLSAARELDNGDRIQLPLVHLKLFGGRGVEHAYIEAIHDWVTRDGLTRAFNRRKFEEELEREFACVARYGRRVSLVLIDIDDFKSINDQFGHPAGDAVLQQFTRLTSEHLRRESIFARVGGDEFAVICPNTSVNAAVKLAERLRHLIHSHRVKTKDASISLTCSFGIAEAGPQMQSPADLYRAADQSLYAGKRAGRGAIVPSSAAVDPVV